MSQFDLEGSNSQFLLKKPIALIFEGRTRRDSLFHFDDQLNPDISCFVYQFPILGTEHQVYAFLAKSQFQQPNWPFLV